MRRHEFAGVEKSSDEILKLGRPLKVDHGRPEKVAALMSSFKVGTGNDGAATTDFGRNEWLVHRQRTGPSVFGTPALRNLLNLELR